MKLLFLLLFIGLHFIAHTQGSTEYDGLQFSLGSSLFHGDVGAGSTKIGFNGSLAYRHIFNEKWSVRPKLSYTTFNGDDSKGNNKERNLSFKNKTIRGELAIIHNFTPYDPAQHNFYGASPYIGFGLGAMTNNPTTEYQGQTYELQELSTEGVAYSRFTFYVPIVLGINLHINNKVYFGFEYSFNYAFSDYLDDAAGTYIDNNKLNGIAATLADRTSEGGYTPSETNDGKTWKEGSKRGSNNTHDFYSIIGFHIGYSFHKKPGSH